LIIEKREIGEGRGVVEDKADAIKGRPMRKKERLEIITRGIGVKEDGESEGITIIEKEGRRRKRRRDEKNLGERRGIVRERRKDKRRRDVSQRRIIITVRRN
jgi:hypothetical protein